MAVYEHSTLLRCKDENGNEYLLYPITKLDCVDGAEDLVHFDKDQELTAEQKAQFLKNIGGLCAPNGAEANKFLKVTAVDVNGNVTAVETAEIEGGTSSGSVETVQSDWNITDETNPAYIKNKPFGIEPEQVVFDGVFSAESYDDIDKWWVIEDSSSNVLEVGLTYTIEFGGVEYESECVEYNSLYVIGNPAGYGGTDNGCPIDIAREATGLIAGAPVWVLTPCSDIDVTADHSCKITRHKTVKQIDLEYLPESLQFGEFSKTIVVDKTTYTGDTFELNGFTYYCCTTDVPPKDNLLDTTYSVFGQPAAPITQDMIMSPTDECVLLAMTVMNTTFAMLMAYRSGTHNIPFDGETITVTVPSAGIYAPVSTADLGDAQMIYATNALKKIDSRYLPDDIGGGIVATHDNNGNVTFEGSIGSGSGSGSGLPEVTTADAGKFLRVTDEGIWAAVEMIDVSEVGL